MADQDKDQYNDEYHFADLEGISPPVTDEEAAAEGTNTEAVTERRFSEPSNIRRNALIVVGIILLAMILYKFLGSYFSDRKIPVKDATPVPEQPKPVPQPVITPTPVPPVVQQPVVQDSPQIEQKISSLEVGQQSMRSEVETVNAQLGGLNTNINNLTAQIAQLNQIINTLNAKVDAQAREIEQLTITRKPKPVKKAIRKVTPAPKYYIQAVIPGRAWLIAPNGSTLTVREGSVLPGYGTVKLIDPNQGRIVTSSGQMIRFSQADS
ncbi:protein IcmG (DotF) [Legionella adelaidensis]|uniref:Protein IcmG (DotF) n=1 Tax=Legionella adelaidensis TaxID=45056 RepID=A0A0W0R663_9GAMM|nr:type IVB secretion system protein IcmG/DotF [Legionella adelaidensis]KTC66533.1 protein IcmG (DotF) [Legionella adelaidensis]